MVAGVRWVGSLALMAGLVCLPSIDGPALAGVKGDQTILPPGLYLFQTRTRSGNCGDAPQTGYVTSAVATLDGVPGARTMTLRLLNSKYWPTWTITVTQDDTIVGDAVMFGSKDRNKGTSHFEVRAHKDRYQGKGTREYPGERDGKPARCSLLYDALLKQVE